MVIRRRVGCRQRPLASILVPTRAPLSRLRREKEDSPAVVVRSPWLSSPFSRTRGPHSKSTVQRLLKLRESWLGA